VSLEQCHEALAAEVRKGNAALESALKMVRSQVEALAIQMAASEGAVTYQLEEQRATILTALSQVRISQPKK